MATIQLTEFGNKRYTSVLEQAQATVQAVLDEHGVEPEGRRVAVNGHPSALDAPVVEGDEVTVIPFVQGG